MSERRDYPFGQSTSVPERDLTGGKLAYRRGPASTYRLQLTPDFGFAAAGAQAAYLAALGVSHVYLSPVLQAAPGSTHGYDVTDHSQISEALGGEGGFREMAARFAAHGLGIVLDIVPNHMAIPVPESLNRQLWEVLRDGPGSRYAHWFDIDWTAGGGKMLFPILGGPVDECMGDISASRDERVLRYFDHVLPLRDGTAGLPLPELLDAQHYRLAWWRDASAKLNWRRFFDINSLIGIRVEDPDVFGATHEVVLRLVAEGLVDGLRVDHPDGLADPRGYVRRLASSADGAWIVVEKILEAGECLPADWPCAGTTGYDALRVVDGLFVDADGGDALTSQYVRFSGRVAVPAHFAPVALAAKREVADGVLAAEVARLARLLRAEAGGTLEDAQAVLTEVLGSFGVYRAYVHPGEPPAKEAEAAVRTAVADALTRLPERLHALAAAVGDLALGTGAADTGAADTAARTEFAIRFGQTTGPVLAKGIEDTASYRWPRLVARNEVGGDPDRFAVPISEFNEFAARLATDWPDSMTTLSTHDTKRQEDVRARLAVLAEMPADWGRRAAEWQYRAVELLPDAAALDPETTYLLWQTLVGAWPLTAERIDAYLTKAMREAKTRTSWLSPDTGYEATVLRVAALALTDTRLRGSIEEFVTSIAPDAAVNSLGAKLVQLTMPGVPDVYQGCELTALSLVDPDNRRPVDFARRHELLGALDSGESPSSPPWPDPGRLDAAKLFVTSRVLRLRREHPEWFGGRYAPLTASGEADRHVVAFARLGGTAEGGAVTVVTRLPLGLRRRGGWVDATLPLPGLGGVGRGSTGGRSGPVGRGSTGGRSGPVGRGSTGGRSGPVGRGSTAWRDALTGVSFGARAQLSDLMKHFPVALLIPEAE
jgi:(1->4)-alpha-D-glucan 1-alpha-D-glucosylmutase